jgi:protein-disulfide isomerase
LFEGGRHPFIIATAQLLERWLEPPDTCPVEYSSQNQQGSEEADVDTKQIGRILAVLGGALIVVIALVVATQLGGGKSSKPSASNISVDSIEEMLQGIPQNGIELGNPKAKVTLIEITDPQCPWCGKYSRDTFPSIIQNYVRNGKVRVEYQGLGFIGEDSARMLGFAQAAALQNKLWNVIELEFENQGGENAGYATDPFLKGIGNAVKGLDVDKAMNDMSTALPGLLALGEGSPVVAGGNPIVQKAQAAYKLAQENFGSNPATPSFVIKRTGSNEVTTIEGAQSYSTFARAIDAQLSK